MPDFILRLRQELLDAGCPASRVNKLTREMEDHFEDLKGAAMSAGLSAADAENAAHIKFGNTKVLAKRLVASMRHSTWCGRHTLSMFGFFPLLIAPVAWLTLFLLELYVWLLLGCQGNKDAVSAIARDPIWMQRIVLGVQAADWVAAAVVTALFCWLAERAAVRARWMLAAAMICSMYAMFSYTTITAHNLSFGLTPHPQWARAAVPMMMAAAAWAWEQRKVSIIQARTVAR